MTTYTDKIGQMRDELRVLYKTAPDSTKGFSALSLAVKETGTLDVRQKEWIALAMSLAIRCEPCINFHIEAMMKAGGTREELVDILAMNIQMAGGPGLMYSGHALACWDELAAKKA